MYAIRFCNELKLRFPYWKVITGFDGNNAILKRVNRKEKLNKRVKWKTQVSSRW
jgi:hypothetical protein